MSDLASDKDIQDASAILSKLQPGFLPQPIFNQITRIVALPILEIVPLRKSGRDIEILLLKRNTSDPIWPDMLHTPGTVLRATDTIEGAIERLLKEELDGTKTSSPNFVTNIMHYSGRGTEVSQIYWVNVLEEAGVGNFYNVNQLPKNLVKTQLDFISLAIDDYKQGL